MVKDERMCDCIVWMNVKNNKFQKEWHSATKPLEIWEHEIFKSDSFLVKALKITQIRQSLGAGYVICIQPCNEKLYSS